MLLQKLREGTQNLEIFSFGFHSLPAALREFTQIKLGDFPKAKKDGNPAQFLINKPLKHFGTVLNFGEKQIFSRKFLGKRTTTVIAVSFRTNVIQKRSVIQKKVKIK